MTAFTRIGPYEIVEELGHGGMGVVYRAHDTRLQRDVALKFVFDGYLGDGTPAKASHERFLREARASSALNHPNICTIYDVGEQSGHPYLVMELLEGHTLKHAIQGQPLPVDQVLQYAIELAAALTVAHEQGILHRDIKPANLFLARRGQNSQVLKVLDFGLAKHAALRGDFSETNSIEDFSGIDASESITTPGSTMGTVAYMAPEQARGEVLDACADIFSAGVVMYEMATGVSPFHGPSIADTFAQLLTKNPEPIRKFAQHFPKDLERVILKALAKQRSLRYPSAAELLADLRQMQAGLRRAPTSFSVGSARGRRMFSMWIAGLTGIVTLSALAFWGLERWKQHRSPQPAHADAIILSEFTNRTGDSVFDIALKQALAFQLQQSPFLNVVSESHLRESLAYLGKSQEEKITPAIAREIAEREGDKAVINGTIASIGNEYLITLEAQNASTGEIFAREQAQASGKGQVLNALHTAATSLRNRLGESLASIQKLDVPFSEATTPSLDAFRAYALGERAQAQANYAASVSFYKHAIELDPGFAMAYARLGIGYVALGDQTDGNAAITRAFELSSGVSERERLYIRAQYYLQVTADLPQAVETLKLYGATYPNDAIVPNDLAVAYLMLGQFEPAYAQVQQTIRINPKSGAGYVNAILSLTALNRFTEAKAAFEKAASLNLADDASIRGMWIYTAYLMGDAGAFQQQLDWARGKPDGYIIVAQKALIEDQQGRLSEGFEDWQRAEAQLADQKMLSTAAQLVAQRTLDRAMVGQCKNSNEQLERALRLDQERTMRATVAIAYGLCGNGLRAETIRRELGKTYTQDTVINHVFLPDIDAAVALGRNRSADALEALRPAADYDTLGINSYLRGLAHLALKEGRSAETDFGFPVQHRSIFVLGQVQGMNMAYPLSLLGLARVYSLEGNRTKAQEQFQTFFDYWKNANADLPPLVAGRKEAVALQHQAGLKR